MESVHNASVFEEVTMISYHTLMVKSSVKNIDRELLVRHFLKKHGKNAYYGQ